MKTYRQKDITVQANSLEEAEVLILNELDSKCRVNEPLEVMEERQYFIDKLKILQGHGDTEIQHFGADFLLCELLIFLGYSDVVLEYEKVNKWYA